MAHSALMEAVSSATMMQLTRFLWLTSIVAGRHPSDQFSRVLMLIGSASLDFNRCPMLSISGHVQPQQFLRLFLLSSQLPSSEK